MQAMQHSLIMPDGEGLQRRGGGGGGVLSVCNGVTAGITYPVNMSDPIRIRSGSAVKPEAGRMILAHRFGSGPDAFGQNLTQSVRTKSDPGWFYTISPRTSVEERNRV